MFNISAGVGRGRSNLRLDVMLVQYLLNMAMNEARDGAVTTDIPIRPPDHPDPLNMDGVCGTNTQKFIDHYQAFRNANRSFSQGNRSQISMQVKPDGAIDPWTFPAQMNIQLGFGAPPLDRTHTLIALCYDAAKNSEVSRGSFATMPGDLKRILLTH